MEAKTHGNTLNSEWMDFQWCILFVLNMAISNPTFLGIWISFDMAGDIEWLMRLQNEQASNGKRRLEDTCFSHFGIHVNRRCRQPDDPIGRVGPIIYQWGIFRTLSRR